MNGPRTFLDTDIVIYAYDISAGTKHKIAKDIMIDLWEYGLGLISTQVLQEFYVNVTQKIRAPLEMSLAKSIVEDLLTWDVVVNDGVSILGAIEIQLKHDFAFWDSMIIQAAIRGGAELLLTEDMSDGLVINGITIENPFAGKKAIY